MEVSQNEGYHLGGPNKKDYNILGSILGSPYFGKLPYSLYGDARTVSRKGRLEVNCCGKEVLGLDRIRLVLSARYELTRWGLDHIKLDQDSKKGRLRGQIAPNMIPGASH